MKTKIVVRLLDETGRLLGWAQVMARAKGDGKLWSSGPLRIPIELRGLATTLSLHWCDVNVEIRLALPRPTWFEAGETYTPYEEAADLITVGAIPGELPAVTVRGPVAVDLLAGELGAGGRAGSI